MRFDFGPYSSLLLPLVIQGLVFSAILAVRGWRQDRRADRLLACLLLLLTLRPMNWMLGFAGWYDTHDAFTTFMFYFPWNWFWLLGPLVYFYFRSLTNRNFHWRRKDLWHFVPTILAKAYLLALFLKEIVIEHQMLGLPLGGHFGTRGPLYIAGVSEAFAWLDWLAPISIFGYLGATLWQFRAYRRYLQAHFSNPDPVDFRWLRHFLIAFLLTQVIYWAFQVVSAFSVAGLSYAEQWYSFFSWGLIIYYLSIAGLLANAKEQWLLDFELKPRRGQPFPPPEVEEKEQPPTPDQLQRAKLETWLAREKPYLAPGLTLKDLADQLDMPQGELSRLINGAYQQNFNDFINRYRVEAVKQALFDPGKQHLSLLGIALDCGFNSKATFNRVFKQHTGLSPSAWRARQEGEKPEDETAQKAFETRPGDSETQK